MAKRSSDNPWNALTRTQKRRLHLRLRGYSHRHIARLEGVCRRSIRDSLDACKRKIPALNDMLSDWGIAP